jgi:RHS repeat-associated protein
LKAGNRKNTEFDYVAMTGYDEYGQRVYVKYGNGTESRYSYDPYRRWLSEVQTQSSAAGSIQELKYSFDGAGNVLGYENNAKGYTTKQSYSYDGLYQLTGVQGSSRSHPGGAGGNEEYRTEYRQEYSFSRIGNMMKKESEEKVSNTNRIGTELNYSLDYEYYPGTHKAERIGTRYYGYDRNGNLAVEREGGHAAVQEIDRPYYKEGDRYWTDYGFGVVRPGSSKTEDGVYQRNYRWNERNLLSESSDGAYTVQYRYGSDGQRALKFTANSGRSTVYFNKMWQTSDAGADWLQGKHIYVNEERIATKYNSEGNDNTEAEKDRAYYYHTDHLGSAQVVTNSKGQIHERLEYTPYGELWIDWKSETGLEDKTPFRFTGKEMDAETGFYYYGARYLDPKTSRWISADPALGDYIPGAPVNDEAKKRNGNLPGQGGVFNYVNLHLYHYAGNNPVKYVDPDGNEQSAAQYRYMRNYVETFNGMGGIGRQALKDNTDIIVTRNYYEGKEIGGKMYYKDNLSIRVFGQEINNIQVQSTVDHSGYPSSEASSSYTTFDAKIGVSGSTNQLIKDTILFDKEKANFMHGPKTDEGIPGSGGCVVTRTKKDEREVMNILRDSIGFKDGETIKWRFVSASKDPQENL